jgi:HKD family nuclease
MAYINAATAKKIRLALKEEFGKAVKFSVIISHHMTLNVAVMQSSLFDDDVHEGVNHYYIRENYEGHPARIEFLEKVVEIIKREGDWYDNSDPMTDYFNTAFYFNIAIGKWEKKHKRISA